jgi:hypothetical protein
VWCSYVLSVTRGDWCLPFAELPVGGVRNLPAAGASAIGFRLKK